MTWEKMRGHAGRGQQSMARVTNKNAFKAAARLRRKGVVSHSMIGLC